MGKSREIQKRMKAVGNIKRITRTMQMIATSKFAKAQQSAMDSKPYTGALFDLVRQLAGAAEGVDHPLLGEPAEGSRELTLVITSDRGLCGPYNGSVVRTALNHLRSSATAREGAVEVVGKKGAAVLRFNKIDVNAHHTQFGDKPSYEDVQRLAQDYIDRFTAGEIGVVRVVSMKYYSAGRQKPEVFQLLPFKAEQAEAEAGAGSSLYEFSPDAEGLLDHLLPAAVKAQLFQCFNDAIVSEHVARMVAMKAATDNAGKMGHALKRKYNRARQSQITTELTEIISGAAALD
ncbi:MAG: ATP synthase F1 subunit gamma [Phycisphaerales bacterium JB059]